MACPVCTDPFNKSTRIARSCCYCQYTACVSCVKRFLLSTVEDPHCMHPDCRRGWSVEFIDSITTHVFRTGELAHHRENVLMDRERSMLPATQVYVEAVLRNKRYDERVKALNAEHAALATRIFRLQVRRNRVRYMDPTAVPAAFDDVDGNDVDDAAAPRQAVQRAAFIKPCPTDGCRGFLSTAYKCGICGTRVCPDCHEVIAPATTAVAVAGAGAEAEEDAEATDEAAVAALTDAIAAPPATDEAAVAALTDAIEGLAIAAPMTLAARRAAHVCNPEVLASVRAIAGDSKPCPKCGAMIFRVSGCDQMYCTVPGCHTAFDFRSGLVAVGRIHNPHYYEFLRRNGGDVPREPGDGPAAACDDNDNVVPPFHRLHARFRGNVAAQTFMEKVHMLVTHVNHVEIPRFTDDALAAEALNRDLRIQLMMNKIGDDAFKRKLYMREKRRHYRDDVRQVLAMVSAVIGDALRTAFADASPTALETATKTLVELRGYANESLGVISKRYKFVVPLITEAWKINSAKG